LYSSEKTRVEEVDEEGKNTENQNCDDPPIEVFFAECPQFVLLYDSEYD